MIWTLVKNHFKRGRPRATNVNTKNILGYVVLIVLTGLILTILGYILFLLTQTFQRLRLPDVYLKIVIFILLIVLTIYEVFNIIKQLFQSKDNEIYLKLPILKEKVFLSKIIYIYLKQLAISITFLFITAGIYGLVESDITIFYYFRLLIIALIIPLLSLVFASVLSIPASFILGFIKKNKIVLIVSLTAVVGLFFLVYIRFVNIVLSFIDLTSGQTSNVIDPNIINGLKNTVNKLFVSSIFYNLLMNNNFLINLLIVLLVIVILVIGTYYLLKHFYYKALNKENEKIDIEFKKEVKVNRPTVSIFKKEIKTLVRNPDYAFQAIVLNILMPIFIYLTIRLTYRAGVASVGREIVPGITLLTILIFLLLANSFQGMIISREKQAHYITKVIPVNIRRQIFAKIAYGYLLNIFVLSITILIITILKYISITEGVVILILSLIFSTAYTLTLVSRDYENPQLTSNEGGFEEGMNMYKSLFTGLILAILVGIVFSVTPFVSKLFIDQRVFRLFNLIIIRLDARKINYLLYGSSILILIIYLISSIFRFRRVVKN